MKDLIFDKSIYFNKYTCFQGHHTDSMSGAVYNYLALMHKGFGRFIGEGYDVEFGPGDMYFVPKICILFRSDTDITPTGAAKAR